MSFKETENQLKEFDKTNNPQAYNKEVVKWLMKQLGSNKER